MGDFENFIHQFGYLLNFLLDFCKTTDCTLMAHFSKEFVFAVCSKNVRLTSRRPSVLCLPKTKYFCLRTLDMSKYPRFFGTVHATFKGIFPQRVPHRFSLFQSQK